MADIVQEGQNIYRQLCCCTIMLNESSSECCYENGAVYPTFSGINNDGTIC